MKYWTGATIALLSIALLGGCDEDTVADPTVASDICATADCVGADAISGGDSAPGDTGPEDITPEHDTMTPPADVTDVAPPDDAVDLPEAGRTDADVAGEETSPEVIDEDAPNPFTDCGELGMADAWIGTFTGLLTYDLSFPSEWGTLPDGPLPVSGVLGFDITCIESKFIVSGDLTGEAFASGEIFPFTLTLSGYYDPETGKLNADMEDAKVLIMDLVEAYFEGTFQADLVTDGDGEQFFDGTWVGYATGTNLGEFVTGEATGEGTWNAIPDVGP